jgi:hypothetical protein
MKRYFLLTTTTLLLASALCGQIDFQSDLIVSTCPYDTTVTGVFPERYEVFITKDNTYEGEIDSSWCPTFVLRDRPTRYDLDLSEFDFDRPLHFRLRYPEGDRPDIAPYVDHIIDYTLWNTHVTLKALENCGNSCSSQIVKTVAEDTIHRVFEYTFSDVYPEIGATNCFFSERFERQQLVEMGLSLYLEPTAEDPQMTTYGFFLTETYDFFLRKEVEAINFGPEHFTGSTYWSSPVSVVSALPREGGDELFFYLPQEEVEVPGNNRFRYTEVNFSPNPDTPVTMQLYIAEWDDIAFPPYTGLIAGKVGGQDSLRHHLEVVYDDWYFGTCFDFFIERVIPENTVHQVGNDQLRFGNDGACVMLETGAGFSVGPGANLDYGANGKGLFASRDGGSLALKEGATMTLNNRLRLLQLPGTEAGGLHLYLGEGSEIIFGESAIVERKFAEADSWIWVHDAGGKLNLENLSLEERALFRFVPEESVQIRRNLEDLLVLGNPVRSNTLRFELPADAAEGVGTYQITDLIGRTLISGKFDAASPSLELPGAMPNGAYLITAVVEGSTFSAKLLLQR